MQVQSLGWEDPLEEGMATHSSTLAWRIPWTEGPGRLQSTGSQKVGHRWSSWAHTCRPCLDFVSYLHNVQYSRRRFQAAHVSGCRVSLASTRQFLRSFFVWHDSGLFEENMSVILEGIPWFGFVWCFCIKVCIPFQIIEIQIKYFWQECHRSNVGSWCITLEDTWCQFVLLVVMITSLRGFSSGKLLFLLMCLVRKYFETV